MTCGREAAWEDSMKLQVTTLALVVALSSAVSLTGCQKGAMQKTGEKIDEATGQDRLIGPGPAEKAGRKTDNTINDVKK
jgi:hypothetical protein